MIRPSFSLWEMVGWKLVPDNNKNAVPIAVIATAAIIPPIIALFNDCAVREEGKKVVLYVVYIFKH